MRSPFPEIDSPLGLAILRWIIGAILVFGLIGCVVKGANNPADPYLSAPSAGSASRTPLAGFGETRVTVHTTDKLLNWCLLLAANNQQRARGLMQVNDTTLGGYNGMLFRYDNDVSESFWMRNTPMPLSIAYISSAGQIVTTADMEPCSDSPDCRDYPPAGPYRFTIEVPQGNLASLGIMDGATIVDENAPCT
ncbi:MAG: uncharacterized protein QOI95_3398 [Acidimicrobiaceae bacterium]